MKTLERKFIGNNLNEKAQSLIINEILFSHDRKYFFNKDIQKILKNNTIRFSALLSELFLYKKENVSEYDLLKKIILLLNEKFIFNDELKWEIVDFIFYNFKEKNNHFVNTIISLCKYQKLNYEIIKKIVSLTKDYEFFNKIINTITTYQEPIEVLPIDFYVQYQEYANFIHLLISEKFDYEEKKKYLSHSFINKKIFQQLEKLEEFTINFKTFYNLVFLLKEINYNKIIIKYLIKITEFTEEEIIKFFDDYQKLKLDHVFDIIFTEEEFRKTLFKNKVFTFELINKILDKNYFFINSNCYLEFKKIDLNMYKKLNLEQKNDIEKLIELMEKNPEQEFKTLITEFSLYDIKVSEDLALYLMKKYYNTFLENDAINFLSNYKNVVEWYLENKMLKIEKEENITIEKRKEIINKNILANLFIKNVVSLKYIRKLIKLLDYNELIILLNYVSYLPVDIIRDLIYSETCLNIIFSKYIFINEKGKLDVNLINKGITKIEPITRTFFLKNHKNLLTEDFIKENYYLFDLQKLLETQTMSKKLKEELVDKIKFNNESLIKVHSIEDETERIILFISSLKDDPEGFLYVKLSSLFSENKKVIIYNGNKEYFEQIKDNIYQNNKKINDIVYEKIMEVFK
jgi:hypothetical protein